MGSAAAAMVTILASSGIARIANIGFRTGWISKEASRISDNVQKRQLDESSPVQKISELDWIPNWLKTRPIILGLSKLIRYLRSHNGSCHPHQLNQLRHTFYSILS